MVDPVPLWTSPSNESPNPDLCNDTTTGEYHIATAMALSSMNRCVKPLAEPPPEVRYVTLISYTLTFALGLCGNSLVIYVISRFKEVRRKSVANYYIWNLALADELYIMSLPLFIWATYERRWPLDGILGNVACKFAYVGRDVTKFASIFTLTALSIDRYLASFSGLGHIRTIRTGKIVCACVWLACLLLSTPYLLYTGTVQTNRAGNTLSCRFIWPTSDTATPLSETSSSTQSSINKEDLDDSYATPLSNFYDDIIGIAVEPSVAQRTTENPIRDIDFDRPLSTPEMMTSSSSRITTSSSLLAPSFQGSTDSAPDSQTNKSKRTPLFYMFFWTLFQFLGALFIPSLVIALTYTALYRRLRKISQRNGGVTRPRRRMVTTVLVIVVTFITCQTPYHVMQFVALDKVKAGEKYRPGSDVIETIVYLNLFSQILVFVSSCCNPVIYGLLNDNYRRLFSSVLCCCYGSRCHVVGPQPMLPPDEIEGVELVSRSRARSFTLRHRDKIPRIRFEISFHSPCLCVGRDIYRARCVAENNSSTKRFARATRDELVVCEAYELDTTQLQTVTAIEN